MSGYTSYESASTNIFFRAVKFTIDSFQNDIESFAQSLIELSEGRRRHTSMDLISTIFTSYSFYLVIFFTINFFVFCCILAKKADKKHGIVSISEITENCWIVYFWCFFICALTQFLYHPFIVCRTIFYNASYPNFFYYNFYIFLSWGLFYYLSNSLLFSESPLPNEDIGKSRFSSIFKIMPLAIAIYLVGLAALTYFNLMGLVIIALAIFIMTVFQILITMFFFLRLRSKEGPLKIQQVRL